MRKRRLRDHLALGWLVAALVITLVHRWVPSSTWLMIHLVLLGALSHSALVWSEHFAHTLLRSLPDEVGVRRQNGRIIGLGVGSLAVFIGVPAQFWWLVVMGASLVAAAILWHVVHLVATMRRALPSRFRIVTRYYIAAGICLPLGAGFGATLALGLDELWHGRFLVAHMTMNLLGWVGLTVTGTLVTFWPTMLRSRMDERAESLARRALPILLGSIVLTTAGALVGSHVIAGIGLFMYLVGLMWWARALWRPLGAKGLREFAPASVAASLLWGVVGLVWMGILVVTSGSWAAIVDPIFTVAAVFVVGFAAQLLTGALSYLVPSAMGGGARVVRAGQRWVDKWAMFRLLVINLGLLLWLFPAPSWVRVTVSSLVVVALALFLPLLVRGALASARAKRAIEAGGAPAEDGPGPRLASGNQAVAAVTALAVAVSLGVAVDPGAVGLSRGDQPAGGVVATGETTRVEVSAEGMSFTPDEISVPAGNRLIVVLNNTDSRTSHDLVIGNARSPRLRPGETFELDAGVMGASVEGYCSVAGHRQMGMTLDIIVDDVTPTSGHEEHLPGAPVPQDPDATLGTFIDPQLPPLDSRTTHRHTFTVTEVPLEVAPGLWQTRWTFNGSSMGPTLHGRVGDVFEITLVNDGTIGHSIDFHAGALAPDGPMRTIAPGESLVYRFTAERAGIWLYHCSTAPMSTHIAAGMHGAVIIEPPDLPEVDHSYVLVQSEVYLANAATTSGDAQELDADKMLADAPDRVVFNGIANQYDHHPFTARTGERVRFWVLNAGPNRALSFHIVGGQFDTTWTEGTYTLRNGRGLDGSTDGGAQVLPLLAAQGGFVELSFPEAGHYPVVNHVMVDAERGAHGIVRVTE